MVDYITGGWLWINNGTDYIKLKCEKIVWSIVVNPEIEHTEGGIDYGWDLGLRYVIIKATGIWVDSYQDIVDFLTRTNSWQQANTMLVSVARNWSYDLIELDGNNTIFPVLMTQGAKDIEKMRGEQEWYRIDSLTLEQVADASG